MSRLVALLLVLSSAALAPLARAADPVTGRVSLPSYGSPAPQRLISSVDATSNGTLGYLFRLPRTSGRYTLHGLPGGMTGLETFDIWFYSDVAGEPGVNTGWDSGCPNKEQIICDKAGEIPAGSAWAIVTLAYGAGGTFTYSS